MVADKVRARNHITQGAGRRTTEYMWNKRKRTHEL